MASYAAAASGSNQPIVGHVDVNHPYYLQTSDHLGMVLVTQLLIDQNYNQWKRSMMIILSTKYKLRMIDGSLPKSAAKLSIY